jgi:glycosyltransferase involved in cell wall biosynthesis
MEGPVEAPVIERFKMGIHGGNPVKRRILHLIYSLYRGGAERIIETHINTARGGDYEFVVCSLTGGGDLIEHLEEAGAQVHLLDKRRRGNFGVLPRIIGLVRRCRIDLLHLHNAPGALWGTLAVQLGRLDIPIVRTEHRLFIPDSFKIVYRLLYPPLTKRARRMLCVCDAVRKSFAARFPALAERFVTVYNGIRLEPFQDLPPKDQCRKRFKLPAGVHLVGTVGRLVPVKNHLGLVTAFHEIKKRVPDAHLAIVGEGDLKDSIVTHAGDLGIADAVSILPVTPDIAQFYRGLDLFVLPSNSEGLPLTLLEALAAELPAVATDVGGIAEVITDGVNGHLVPAPAGIGLAERSIRLLLDRERASAMGKAGRETVSQRFTAARMVEGIERVYEEVLGGRGAEPAR